MMAGLLSWCDRWSLSNTPSCCPLSSNPLREVCAFCLVPGSGLTSSERHPRFRRRFPWKESGQRGIQARVVEPADGMPHSQTFGSCLSRGGRPGQATLFCRVRQTHHTGATDILYSWSFFWRRARISCSYINTWPTLPAFTVVAIWQNNLDNLGSLMQDVSLDVTSWEETGSSLKTKWRFRCVLGLPWKPTLAAAGVSQRLLLAAVTCCIVHSCFDIPVPAVEVLGAQVKCCPAVVVDRVWHYCVREAVP